MCMNLESFFLFLERAQLETLISRINYFTYVVHANTGDVIWVLSYTHACTGGLST